MKTITIPFSEDLLFGNIDNLQDYIVDISQIDFQDEELNKDKINCTFTYIRNLNLDINLDFSSLSYDEKENWILNYINVDLFDLYIKDLSETFINLLSDEENIIENTVSILSIQEIKKFRENHINLLNNIKQFIVSLEVILEYAVHNVDQEKINNIEINNYPRVKEKPLFFESVHQLIKNYPIIFDALLLYYSDKYELVNYEYVIHNIEKSSLFYLDFLNLPSVKFLGLVLSFENK